MALNAVRKPGGVLAAVALFVSLVAAPPAEAEVGPGVDPGTVTAAPAATWQTNGTVWAVEIVDGVAYVGGNFTSVRPPGAALGTSEVPRSRLAAFDAVSGELLPWAPLATSSPFTPVAGTPVDKNCTAVAGGQLECATVWAIAVTPDKKSIIVGGDFQRINGSVRAGIAAFTTATGSLNSVFKPSLNGRVYSVAATDSTVYVGGSITRAGGQDRSGLASFALSSGALLPWAPTVVRGTSTQLINGVRSLVVTNDESRVIVGGGFNALAGVAKHGLGAVDAVTGAAAPWGSDRIASVASVTSVNVFGDTVYTTADALGSVSASSPSTRRRGRSPGTTVAEGPRTRWRWFGVWCMSGRTPMTAV